MADNNINILIKAKNEASREIDNTSRMLGGMTRGIAAVGAAFLTWESAKAIISGIVQAGVEAEASLNKLRDAVGRSGQDWNKLGDQLQSFAGDLQKVTGFDDEQITEGLAKFINFGQTATQSMRNLGLAADFAAGNNMELGNAVDILAKVNTGNVAQLGRYIGAINTNMPKAQQIEEASKRLEEMFGGAAAARMNTVAGRILDVQNAWDDFLQSIYDGANSGPLIRGFLAGLAESLRQIPAILNAGIGALKSYYNLFTTVFSAAKNNLSAFVTFTKSLVSGDFGEIGLATANLTDTLSAGVTNVGKAFDDVVLSERTFALQTRLALAQVLSTASTAANAVNVLKGSTNDKNGNGLIVKALFGEDDNGDNLVKDLVLLNGQLREFNAIEANGLRSSEGKAKMSWEMEQQGPTPKEVFMWRYEQEQEALEETQRKAQESFAIISSSAQFALDPMKDMILSGQSIGDTFQAMGDRIKNIFVNEIINYISQAIAKLILFKGLGSDVNIGVNPVSGLFGALGSILPFDNRHNDSMLQREVMWVGRLITNGLTQGMMQGIQPQAQPAMAGGQNIAIHFHGPVSSDRDIRERVIPQLEEAIDRSFTRIKAGPRQLTGRRNGFSN